jgi:glycosyltransferase involved in cell wall biosynthesis
MSSIFLSRLFYQHLKACENITAEIIIVDNHSVDGSVEFITQKFIESGKSKRQYILLPTKKTPDFRKQIIRG